MDCELQSGVSSLAVKSSSEPKIESKESGQEMWHAAESSNGFKE